MKRKLMAGLLLLALLLTMLPCSSMATDVTFVAVNDDLLDLGLYTPISSGDVTYLPGSVFTGSLGIVFSHNVASKTASLYTSSKTLYFDLTDSYSYDTQGNFYETGALLRDNRVYVPLDFVCAYFGLIYSWIPVEYGTLFRLKNSSAVLTDTVFVSAAEQSMRRRYNTWLEANSGTADPSPTYTDPVISPEPIRLMSARLYIHGELGDMAEALLDRLDALGVSCAFFTTAESLEAYPDLVRRILCTGHTLAIDSADAESADAFNNALDAIALTRTRLVCCSPEQAAELRELGYVPCFADLEPDLSSDQAPTSHQTALSLRRLAEDADLSAALGLRLEENTADYIGQLVIELGSNCLWESTNEVSAAA